MGKVKEKKDAIVPLNEDEDYIVWTLLSITRVLLSKARERELKNVGLTSKQAGGIHALKYLGDGVRPIDLSRFFLKEPHTISESIDRMVKKGLIVKSNDSTRKNVKRIQLSDKGEKLYTQVGKRESIHKIMGCLSGKEREQLKSILIKLRDEALKVLNWDIDPIFP